MIELPDDELDKLFRKSSEEFDPTYDPQDWDKLEQLLDKQDGRSPMFAWMKKWWPMVLLGLLFLGGGITYYALRVNKGNPSPKVTAKHTDLAKSETKNAEDKKLEKSEKIPKIELSGEAENGIPPVVKATETDAGAYGDKKNLTKEKNDFSKILPRSGSKAGGVFLEPNRSKSKGGSGALFTNSRAEDKSVKLKDKVTVQDPQSALPSVTESLAKENLKKSVSDISENDKSVTAVLAEQEIGKEQKLVINASPLAVKQVTFNNLLLPSIKVPAGEQPVVSSVIKSPSPRFAVRFGYSPDMSSVKFMNGMKTGSSVALLGEYSFLPNFYVQSGAIRSVKKYVAQDGDYLWPSDWKQSVLPDNVDGSCRIIEVPLNFRYDISSTDRRRWFATTGVSSYHMQNEKYKYNYKKHVPGIKWYSWEGKTGWYWLSHLNASIGYEYRLSKKLSVLAEPYATIPLKKVGYGKVNLFSTGIWISVRYAPSFKK